MIKISLLLKRLRENFEIPNFFFVLWIFFRIKIVLLPKSLGAADVIGNVCILIDLRVVFLITLCHVLFNYLAPPHLVIDWADFFANLIVFLEANETCCTQRLRWNFRSKGSILLLSELKM